MKNTGSNSTQSLTETVADHQGCFAFAIIDSLTAHIAVLDENGIIIAVNQAWRKFAEANPPVGTKVCEGACYLAVCEAAEGEDRDQALACLEGIRAVMANRIDSFFMEYPCHSPSERRWFAARFTRLIGPGPLRIVVAHENITERKLAEESLKLYREHLEELVRERTRELEETNTRLAEEIAERQRAQEAIHMTEEGYRALVELAPDIIYRIREDRTIDFISGAVRQLGYDPNELIGKPFEEIVHPDDRQRVRRIIVEKRIGPRRMRNIEIRLCHKSHGDQHFALNHSFVELSARGYWNVCDGEITRSDKQFLYTLGIAHDITPRKVTEQALIESERRIALLKDVASAANAAATIDDVFQVAVEGIARHIGWPVGHVYIADERDPNLLKPSKIWYLADEHRYDLFVEITSRTSFTPGVGMIGRVLENRKAICLEDLAANPEFLRKRLDQDMDVHGAFGFPVIVRGNVNAVLEFFSDKRETIDPSLMDMMEEIGIQLGIVIQRKKDEASLKTLYRAVEQSPATILITDVKGRIQYANPKFYEMTGYSPQEALANNPRILNSGIHPKQFFKELWETIVSGNQWYGQICNRKKDGEFYWERASISPVRNERGKITNYVAVKEDVTKLLQYEAELKQAKESAESANRAKSNFLAGMSHELRTPLNAIIGFSEVLQEQYFGPLNDKQKEYVSDILESGKHLLSLINDILDLSKVEAGKMELERSLVNIPELLSHSMIMIKEKAARHRIRLDLDIDIALENFQMMADDRKLKQILFNLLANAVKFTPDGGSIRLQARRTSDAQPVPKQHADDEPSKTGVDEAQLHEEGIEICVEDTGIGIPLEHQEKIFEPFFQMSNPQKDKPPGTGLGLPLSKQMIELHGGTIHVESGGPGTGSRFVLRIPVR